MPPRCVKCADADATEARVHLDSGARCLDCLCSFLAVKFAKALGRANASGPHAQLAIGVSGGYSSAALAHMAVAYVRSIRRRPGHAAPMVTLLHVAEREGGGGVRANASARDTVESLASSLPGTALRVLEGDDSNVAPALRDADDMYMIRTVGRLRALQGAATEAGATLLLGVSATRQAELLLTGVVAGRPGVHWGDAVLPLSDARTRHLVRYARHLLPDAFVNPPVKAPIVQVVTRFVAAVERDNVSAVHNVVRTAARLLVPNGPRCALCDTPIPTGRQRDVICGDAVEECQSNGKEGCDAYGCSRSSNDAINNGVVCEVVPDVDDVVNSESSIVNGVDDENVLCAACEAIVVRAEKKGVSSREQLLRAARGEN